MTPPVYRQQIALHADPSRVVARPFLPSDTARIERIAQRILALPPAQIAALAADIRARYQGRHRDFDTILARHAALVMPFVPSALALSEAQRFVIGATFTLEYSIEAAALFNPSIVPHPDQSGIDADARRVILSFRATGEGHISSLTFRAGIVSAEGLLQLDPPEPWATLPTLVDHRHLFPPEVPLGERTLFPVMADERMGIEDVRWVRFDEASDGPTWYGPYTAYDGQRICPKLLATQDFATFEVIPLQGAAVLNKGVALFPRRIGGEYVMLGRQDNEQNYLMRSARIDRWEEATFLRGPQSGRELVQIGNNGSPIETEAGWLLLTHGVGPMREYTLSVDLLDLDDPSRVIATLPHALLAPLPEEREGYVPNVVYSCGAMQHNGWLVIPYAYSDAACNVARVRVDELLDALR